MDEGGGGIIERAAESSFEGFFKNTDFKRMSSVKTRS